MFWIRSVIFLVLVAFTLGEKKSSAILANYDGDRSEPINIEQADAIIISNEGLLLNGEGEDEKATLINTGKSVEVRLAQKETNLFITGEVIGNYLFIYTRTIFYFAPSSNGVAGTTINGEDGTPLEILVILYNTKYESYYEALNHPDGTVGVRIRVKVDAEEENEKFQPFAEELKKVERSGETAKVEMKKHNSWYLDFNPSKYYAYPGSLYNISTENTYDCSITVVKETPISISQNQFESSFLELKNSEGGDLSTSQDQKAPDGRPIIYANEKAFLAFKLEDSLLFSDDGFPGQ